MSENAQIKSKDRVKDFGEVFTNPREVKAMLDLVKDESYRIDSTFLEPACGNGNFLIEILDRKLESVSSTANNQNEWTLLSLVAVGSIYAIDIQEDNVEESKERLFSRVCEVFKENFKEELSEELKDAFNHVLDLNIIHGDGLTGLQHGKNVDKEIMFSSWNFDSLLEENKVVREDFSMNSMITHNKRQNANKEVNTSSGSLFAMLNQEVVEEEQKPDYVKEYKSFIKQK